MSDETYPDDVSNFSPYPAATQARYPVVSAEEREVYDQRGGWQEDEERKRREREAAARAAAAQAAARAASSPAIPPAPQPTPAPASQLAPASSQARPAVLAPTPAPVVIPPPAAAPRETRPRSVERVAGKDFFGQRPAAPSPARAAVNAAMDRAAVSPGDRASTPAGGDLSSWPLPAAKPVDDEVAVAAPPSPDPSPRANPALPDRAPVALGTAPGARVAPGVPAPPRQPPEMAVPVADKPASPTPPMPPPAGDTAAPDRMPAREVTPPIPPLATAPAPRAAPAPKPAPQPVEAQRDEAQPAPAGPDDSQTPPATPQEAGHAALDKVAEEPLDFFDKLHDVRDNPVQLVPYLGSAKELYDIGHVGLAAYRLSEADKSGAAPDPEDVQLVRAFVAHQNRDTTFGYKVVSVLAALPGFAGELATTGGIYTAGEKIALKAGKVALEKFGSKAGAELLEKLAARALAREAGEKVAGVVGKTAAEKALEFSARAGATAVGSAAQTIPSSAFRIATKTVERMLPQFEFTENEKGELAATVAREGDDFGPAMAKAFGDQFAEVFSEHTGGALAFVPGAEKLRLMKSALMQRWFQGHPGAVAGKFAKLVRKAGWHGVVGEMFEERVGDATRAALGLQSWRDVIPSPQQLLVEAVSFGLPGTVGAAGHAIAGRGGRQGHAERMLPPAAAIRGSASEPTSKSAAPPAVVTLEEPSFSQTSVVAPGLAGASRSTTEPATAPVEGATGREADPAAPVAKAVENAPHVELARRQEELATLPSDASPFQGALLKSRIQDLRTQVASAATQQTTRASHETAPSQEGENSASPNNFTNARTPSAVRSSTEASPTASPAPFSGNDPAQEWGGVQKSDVGRTIVTRNGKRGVITDVGRYTVRFRLENETFDAAHRQNTRVIEASRPVDLNRTPIYDETHEPVETGARENSGRRFGSDYGTALPPWEREMPRPGTPEYQKARELRDKENQANGASKALEDLLGLAD